MNPLYSTTSFTVSLLLEKIDSGELGLPELQRPFVWKDSKVRDLFDSMMRGYPIGYFMLWECPSLTKKKSIGVGEHAVPEPKEVIIDGQQRLTSLYAVIKNKKVLNSSYQEKSIIISYHPIWNKFEVGTMAIQRSAEWIYNISELFSSSSFTFIQSFLNHLEEARAKKGEVVSDEEKQIIADNINAVYALTSQTLAVFSIKDSAEEEDVSDIFVRVNSKGTPLKQNDFILTLVSLYWEEGRKLIEDFCMSSINPPKAGETTSYNLITSVDAQDIIRVVMAYAFDRGRLKYGYKLLRGADFDRKGVIDVELRDARFTTLKEKLPDVLNINTWHEFIKTIMNAGYHSGDLILSGNTIFYAYAFYLIAKERFSASYNENLHLTSLWFFYASLVSLYTGSFESTFESHLNALKTLNTLDEYKSFILSRVEERLTNDFFDITLVGSEGLAVAGRGNNAWNAYVASLVVLDAKILFSKSSMLLSKLFEPGSDGKRKSLEKHHLFPKAYLKSLGYPDHMINQMANYAFIDWKDNMEILDEAPSKYYPIICEGRTPEEIRSMEIENALPEGWEKMDYETFLVERRKLMAEIIKKAYLKLKGNVN